MADKAEIEIEVNSEIYRIALESKLIIEQFQKLLGVYTTTEALAKVAVLMREDDTADRLLSKAMGHLHSCSESGSNELYQEIAAAFGESGLTKRAPDRGRSRLNLITLNKFIVLRSRPCG